MRCAPTRELSAERVFISGDEYELNVEFLAAKIPKTDGILPPPIQPAVRSAVNLADPTQARERNLPPALERNRTKLRLYRKP